MSISGTSNQINKLQSKILFLYVNKDDKKYLTFDKDNNLPGYKYVSFANLNDIDPLNQDILFGNNYGIDTKFNDILNIGNNNANTINIGSSVNTNTINIGTNNNFTTINIGDSNDIVNIAGEFNVIKTNNIEVFNKKITLNKDSIGSGTARGVGINIRDNNKDDQGYIKVGITGEEILFKAPESQYQAKLKVDNQDTIILTEDNLKNFKYNNEHTFVITNNEGNLDYTKSLQLNEGNIIINPINDIIIKKDIYYDVDKQINKKNIKITTSNNDYMNIFNLNLNINSSYYINFNIVCKTTNIIYSASFNGSFKINFTYNDNNEKEIEYINLETCIDDEISDIDIKTIIINNEIKINVKGLDNNIINWIGIFKIIKI